MGKHTRYADSKNPTIQAILSEMYRFASPADAQKQLDMLRGEFICASRQPVDTENPSLLLWIRGFGLSKDDGAHGVVGHFAQVSIHPIDSAFTLSASHVPVDYRQHPVRGQVDRGNPNWGHPILRAIRKDKRYGAIEDAQKELAALHQAFPKVSIPNPGKLYIMIYCPNRPPKQRLVKHILEIEATSDGQFHITCRENTHKPSAKPKTPAITKGRETAVSTEAQGRFTAKITAARLKKPAKSPRTDQKSD